MARDDGFRSVAVIKAKRKASGRKDGILESELIKLVYCIAIRYELPGISPQNLWRGLKAAMKYACCIDKRLIDSFV